MSEHPTELEALEDDTPPFLGSWKNLYTLVIVLHAFIIFLFYLFTHAYA